MKGLVLDGMSDMDVKYLEEAIQEARKSMEAGGIPIGSVLVRDDEIIGRGHNRRVQDDDPVTHAEIDCLRNAGRIKRYGDTTLYSTLMPCHMCAGAIVQFGIKRVVVGEANNFSGAKEYMESHGVEIVNLDMNEPKELLNKFKTTNPEVWKEDVGEL